MLSKVNITWVLFGKRLVLIIFLKVEYNKKTVSTIILVLAHQIKVTMLREASPRNLWNLLEVSLHQHLSPID